MKTTILILLMSVLTSLATEEFDTLLAKAKTGDLKTQAEIAERYYSGNGTPKNFSSAIVWARNAAQHGNRDAQWIMGRMLFNGDGVARNTASAVNWFLRSANQGSSRSQYELSIIGTGTIASDPRISKIDGYKWFLLADSKQEQATKEKFSTIEQIYKDRLSAEQVAIAQKLASSFVVKKEPQK